MGFWDRVLGRSSGQRADDSAAAPPPQPPGEDDILASLDAVRSMLADGAAPGLVRSRVARIDRTIRATLPRLAHLGLGSADAYAVVATATDYLPEAVGGYLRLPREWADSRPIEGGRTALMLLVDQLELLASTMDKMLDAANRADAQALVAHGRFLQSKFDPGGAGEQLSTRHTASTPKPTSRSTSGNALDLD